MQLLVSEIIEKIAAATTKQEKLRILNENASPCMKEILRYSYDPNIKFYTKTIPLYKKDDSPVGLSLSSLFNEYKKLYIFLDPTVESRITGKPPISIKRKHELLIQMLETIHPSEASLLTNLIMGQLPIKIGLTRKVLEEAFPRLFK